MLPALIRCLPLRSMVTGLTALTLSSGPQAAPPSNNPGDHPLPKIYPCAGQLTRPADVTITMVANKTFYKITTSAPIVATLPVFDSGYPITAAAANAMACKRRVIDIVVPSSASSGCADCYPNAEVNVCAGSFSGSVLFEHHCRVPSQSTSATKCKTFKHPVEVYKKASGAAEFDKTPLQPTPLLYRGVKGSDGCRAYAKHLGQIWDTAEAYPNVVPPTSGTDVYRVLSNPAFDGATVDSVVFVEFERQ
jgi:hypothetical protein